MRPLSIAPGHILSYVALCLLLTSCALNKRYLRPETLPSDLKQVNVVDQITKKSAVLELAMEGPLRFIDEMGQPIEFGYDIESHVFESSSGNRLHGWMLTPTAHTKAVTLVFFHGNAAHILNHVSLAIPLVREGYRVFIFDYSGFGFSEGKATRDHVLQDGKSAINYVHNKLLPKDHKMILYGQSLGGHLAACLAVQYEDILDGLVIEGAFSSHKDVAADQAGLLGRIVAAEKYSGRKSIQTFHKPVLIIHSTEDEVVSFDHGQRLYDHANEPKTFYPIDKCHVCGPEYYAEEISQKMMDMISN